MQDTAEESGPEAARAPAAGTAGSGRRCRLRATSSSSSRSPASTGAPRAWAAEGGSRPPWRPRRTPFGNRHANVPRSVGNFWISLSRYLVRTPLPHSGAAEPRLLRLLRRRRRRRRGPRRLVGALHLRRHRPSRHHGHRAGLRPHGPLQPGLHRRRRYRPPLGADVAWSSASYPRIAHGGVADPRATGIDLLVPSMEAAFGGTAARGAARPGGARGTAQAPSASRFHRVPTHFPLNLHGI